MNAVINVLRLVILCSAEFNSVIYASLTNPSMLCYVASGSSYHYLGIYICAK
jgi:hypothetical protein